MIKSWFNMWRRMFDYKGNTSRKEYWSAWIVNVPAMFIFCVPFALILRNFPISPEMAAAVFLIVFNIPTVALYFRRANDANWKPITTIYAALTCPVVSGLLVGAIPSIQKGVFYPRFYSIIWKLFALSFGLFFYGGILGIILFDDPTAIFWLSCSGLILGAGTIIYIGIKNLI